MDHQCGLKLFPLFLGEKFLKGIQIGLLVVDGFDPASGHAVDFLHALAVPSSPERDLAVRKNFECGPTILAISRDF